MSNFRQCFRLNKPINWMPQHLATGLKQIQQKIRNVDCIIEVHDARLPISGRNLDFQKSITHKGAKPHILVLNKKDLTDTIDHRLIRAQLRGGLDRYVIFTNANKKKRCNGVECLYHLATRLINETRFGKQQDFNLMVIGLPKVGKTSIITALQNVKKMPRALKLNNRVLIQERPTIFLHEKDVSLHPIIRDDETGMKLALIDCLPKNVVDSITIADFLLYWLNKQRRFEYVKLLGLQTPCDDIIKVLTNQTELETETTETVACSGGLGASREIEVNINAAAKKFINLFRIGEFGAFNLDAQCVC